MNRFFRNNGLSLVLFVLFFLSLIGQYLTGRHEFNEDQKQHGQSVVSYVEYLGEGHFIEAVFENWESEFLQMATYVVLTVFLFQKGSSESKEPGTIARVDFLPKDAHQNPNSPYPVRRGGLLLKFYQNSLGIALILLFGLSFVLHAIGGVKDYNGEQIEHGAPQKPRYQNISAVRGFGSSRFKIGKASFCRSG